MWTSSVLTDPDWIDLDWTHPGTQQWASPKRSLCLILPEDFDGKGTNKLRDPPPHISPR